MGLEVQKGDLESQLVSRTAAWKALTELLLIEPSSYNEKTAQKERCPEEV